MAQHEPWNADRATAIVAAVQVSHGGATTGVGVAEAARQTAMLPILHALQTAFGCVPVQAEPLIAAQLNVSRADVHGAVSFYHDFRRSPPGRHVLRLCRAEACQSVGADTVAHTIRTTLGVDWHDTSADGAVTLEPVFCLGLCASGPAALVDGQPVGRLTAQGARDLLQALP
ncbi:MAG TPA: formate dehydrogenase subunit gamma [Rhodopila sp.]|jgi:formate dehydrogenase subunit gamma|nr:formate dehydrogenase subunit gamma [Rhodopila sp.]